MKIIKLAIDSKVSRTCEGNAVKDTPVIYRIFGEDKSPKFIFYINSCINLQFIE